jgi:hypothetical protein
MPVGNARPRSPTIFQPRSLLQLRRVILNDVPRTVHGE